MSEEKEETPEERAKSLFERGESSFEKGNYLEALHYFKLSNKLKRDQKTEESIKKCEEKVNEIRQKEADEEKKKEENGTENPKNEDDEACEKIIKNNNYYEILGVNKDTNNEEIKKAYKKLAIKFHPDKNKSTKAEEAFKKIATAYQTLTDPKKRELFDRYGSEEEYRDKVYQERQQQYEEFDPYDIFDMFFGGMDPETLRRRRRQFQRAAQHQQRVNPKLVKYLPFIQILPILFMGLTYIIPILLQKKEIYVFSKSMEYPFEKKTHHYKVPYFVGNDFSEKYKTNKEIKEIEKEIEDKYLVYLRTSCDEKIRMRDELKVRMLYYRKESYYYRLYQNEINKIDLSICDKQRKYLKKIDRIREDEEDED